MTKQRLAFTLVELMVVVLILGALAFVAIPRIGESATTAKTNACAQNVDQMNIQIELYNANEGSWSGELGVILKNADYFPDGPPACPHSGTCDYVYNTMTNRIDEHSH